MKPITFCLMAAALLVACAKADTADFTGTLAIVPQPVSVQTTMGNLLLDENFAVWHEKDHAGAARVAHTFAARMRAATGWKVPVQEAPDDAPPRKGLLLTSKQAAVSQPEGYELQISETGMVIRGQSESGLFYGIQTLYQLMPPAVYGTTAPPDLKWELPLVQITDYPRFGWRGLHLDVSRHMSPVAYIKKHLDYMAMHKLNVFHWHLTDDQGWRIEIKQYPLLTEIGAWRKETLVGHGGDRPKQYDGKPYGGFYTQEEVKEIVAYAAERHITVVPEIEMPGHATAAIAAYPALGTSGERPEVVTSWGIFPDIFNVEDSTFLFLENVLTEVMGLFPSQYIHIGGDEALKDQWKASARVQQRMKELGLKDEHELQSWFITRIEKFVNAKGRSIIGWDEILEGGLAPNAAVMSWRGEQGGIAAAKSGHPVVMSPTDYLYFDYYQGDPTFEPLCIGGMLPLEKVYRYDPMPAALDSAAQRWILGAQANLWTEYLPTTGKIEYMVFPRVAALAEVVWSQPQHKDWEAFKLKLLALLRRYDALGIGYAPSALLITFQVHKDAEEELVTLQNQLGLLSMHYTLDGTAPTLASPVYEAPVRLKVGEMIRARLFINGDSLARETTYEYGQKLDKPRF